MSARRGRILATLLLIGFLSGHAQIVSGPSTTSIQFQNGGVKVGGPLRGYGTINFTSGCTASWVSGTLAIASTGGGGLPSLAPAYIWVGNASSVATAVAMSGDCGLSNAGAITCTDTGGVAFGALATLASGAIPSGYTLPWAQVTSAPSSFPPNGSAAGKLSGSYPNPGVNLASGDIPNNAANTTGTAGSVAPVNTTTAYSFSMTGSATTNIASATLVTPSADTNYSLTGTLIGKTVGSGGTCTTGTVDLRLSWTDADSGFAITSAAGAGNLPILTAGGPTVLTTSFTFFNAIANAQIGRIIPTPIRAKSGVAVILYWDENAASNCTTPPVLELRPILTAIGG